MSFDIYLQDFADDASNRSSEVVSVLGSRLDDSRENVITGDGSAAVYGLDEAPVTGVMFNGVEGDEAWQAIYDTAVAANWVVMPVGKAVCIVSELQRSSLPDELAEDGVALVGSGAQLKVAATGS